MDNRLIGLITNLFTGDNLQRLVFSVTSIGVLFSIGWGIFTYRKSRATRQTRNKKTTTGEIIDAFGDMSEEERGRTVAALSALYRIERTEPEKAAAVQKAISLLKKGDTARAEDILRRHLESQRLAGRNALREAAATARHLGAFVYLHDTRKALESYREAVVLDPEALEGWLDLGRVARRAGDSDEALRASRELMGRAQQQRQIRWQAIAHLELGDIDALRGDGSAASKRYQQTETLLKRWVEQDPNDPQRQRDLSVSHNKIGDMHVANGDGARALAAYQDGLLIARRLTELDPGNTEWQRDLSVSFDRVGDMHVANGDGARALAAYQDGLSIREKLTEIDPGNSQWQRDLSVSHNKIGDMHRANGDGAKALAAYQDGLLIARKLTELDPGNSEWQRDLSVSHNKIGDMHKANGDGARALAAYQDGLLIARKLTELDPGNSEWQRDLSVSHNKIGDMHRANGDGAKALAAYQDGLLIARKLTELDPGNSEWQRDLSVSHNKIGDMHKANGDGARALAAYQDGLSIREKLTELDPMRVEWKTDVAVSLWKMSALETDGAQRAGWLREALDILEPLAGEDRLAAEQREWIAVIKAALAESGPTGQPNGRAP